MSYSFYCGDGVSEETQNQINIPLLPSTWEWLGKTRDLLICLTQRVFEAAYIRLYVLLSLMIPTDLRIYMVGNFLSLPLYIARLLEMGFLNAFSGRKMINSLLLELPHSSKPSWWCFKLCNGKDILFCSLVFMILFPVFRVLNHFVLTNWYLLVLQVENLWHRFLPSPCHLHIIIWIILWGLFSWSISAKILIFKWDSFPHWMYLIRIPYIPIELLLFSF